MSSQGPPPVPGRGPPPKPPSRNDVAQSPKPAARNDVAQSPKPAARNDVAQSPKPAARNDVAQSSVEMTERAPSSAAASSASADAFSQRRNYEKGSTRDAKAAVTESRGPAAAAAAPPAAAAAAAAAGGSRRKRPIFAPWAHYMAYFTSFALLAGGGAVLHGIYRRPTAFWVNNADLYLPVAIIALVYGAMLAMIEYASDRTGDPADEDAAAKQAVEQDDPSILEAATTRNSAMWPEFIISNLNRLNSYTSKVKKRDGHYGFAPANSSGLLARALLYVLPVPVLILVDPTVTPACFLVVTAVFYTLSYRAGELLSPITGLKP